jgi:hypothetical protein
LLFSASFADKLSFLFVSLVNLTAIVPYKDNLSPNNVQVETEVLQYSHLFEIF